MLFLSPGNHSPPLFCIGPPRFVQWPCGIVGNSGIDAIDVCCVNRNTGTDNGHHYYQPLRLRIGSASITPRFLVADATMVFEPGPLCAAEKRRDTHQVDGDKGRGTVERGV
jgi:hypothetical protein